MSRDTLRLTCLVWLTLTGVAAAQPPANNPNDVGVATMQNFSGGASFAGSYFQIQNITGNGVGYQNGFTQFGHLLPFWITDDLVVASNNRIFVTDTSQAGGNIGGFARYYSPGMDRIFGVNGYYDIDRSIQNFSYQQGGVGVETLGRWLDFRANGYMPTNTNGQYTGTALGIADPTSLHYFGHYIGFMGTGLFQSAQSGADFEFGMPLTPQTPWLRGYAGAYYYNSQGPNTTGFRGRIEGWVADDLNLAVMVTNDNQYGTNVNAMVNFLFSGWRPTRWFPNFTTRDRMLIPVQRNWRIATGNYAVSNIDIPALNARTHLPYFIDWVDNSKPAGGNGTFEHPFNYMPATTPRTDGYTSSPGADAILVRVGVSPIIPVLGSTVLYDYERVLGEGRQHQVQLEVQYGNTIVPAQNYNLPGFVNTGIYPTITSPATIITLANNNEVSALNLVNSLGKGIGNTILGSNNFDINYVNATNNLGGGIMLTQATGVGSITNVNALNNFAGGIAVDSGFAPLALNIQDVTSNSAGLGTQAFGISVNADNGPIAADLTNVTANGNQTGIILNETASSLTAFLTNVDASNNINGLLGNGDGIRSSGNGGILFLNFLNVSTIGNDGDGIRLTGANFAQVTFLGDVINSDSNTGDNLSVTLTNGSTLAGSIFDSFFTNSTAGGGMIFNADASHIGTAAAPFLIDTVVADGNQLDNLNFTLTTGSTLFAQVTDSSFSNSVAGYGIAINADASAVGSDVAPVIFQTVTANGNFLDNMNVTATGGSTVFGQVYQSSFNNSITGSGVALNADGNTTVIGSMLVPFLVQDSTATGNAVDGVTDTETNGATVFLLVDPSHLDGNTRDGFHFDLSNGSTFVADFENDTLNGNTRSAVFGIVDASTVNLLMNSSTGTGSGADGMFITSNNLSNTTVVVNNGDFSDSGQNTALSSAVRFDADNSIVNMTLTNTPGSNTAPPGPETYGLQLNLTNGTTFTGLVDTGAFNSNLFNGVFGTTSGATTTATLELRDTTIDLNGGNGVFVTANTGSTFTINATTNNTFTDISSNGLSGIFGVANTGSTLIVNTTGATIDSNNIPTNAAGDAGVVFNNFASTIQANFNTTAIGAVGSGNFGGGVIYNGFGSLAGSSLTFTSTTVDGNTGGGIFGNGLLFSEAGGNLALNITGITGAASSFSNNTGSGIDGTVSGATGVLTITTSTDPTMVFYNVDSNAKYGMTLSVFTGAQMAASFNGGTFGDSPATGNGSAGAFDGVHVLVDGTGSLGTICFDGSHSNNNTHDGFNFIAQNNGTLYAGLQTSGQYGTLTATGNANKAVEMTVTTGGSGYLFMNGPNVFSSPGGGTPISYTANGAANAAFGFSGTLSGYNGDGIDVSMDNVAQAWIDIHDANLTGNAGNTGSGINLQLDSLAAGNTVTFATDVFTAASAGFLQTGAQAFPDLNPFEIINSTFDTHGVNAITMNANNVTMPAVTGAAAPEAIGGNTITNTGGDGIFVDVKGASNIDHLYVGGYDLPAAAAINPVVGNNIDGTGGAGNGINFLLENTSRINTLSMDGNTADKNALNGLLFTASAGTKLNTLTVNGLTTGTGDFSNNGASGINVQLTGVVNDVGPLTGPVVSIDGGDPNAMLANRTVNDNGSIGIHFVANATPLTSLTISNNTVDPNQGNGVEIDLTNSTTVGIITMNNNDIENNIGDGIKLLAMNTAITTLNITNSGINGNQGNGINLDLTGSPITNLNITGNQQTTITGANFQFQLGSSANIETLSNTSIAGVSMTAFHLDLTTGVNSFLYDTVEPGISTIFSPDFGVVGDTATVGLITIDGQTIKQFPVPLQDPAGMLLVGGGIPDNSQVLDMTFGTFGAGQKYDWLVDTDYQPSIASGPSGSDGIGSLVSATFSNGQVINGVLAADPGNPTGAIFTSNITPTNLGISNNLLDGIHISQQAGSNIGTAIIDSNQITGNMGALGTHAGINFDTINASAIHTLTISNNTIQSNTGDGVRFGSVTAASFVGDAGTNVQFLGNTIGGAAAANGNGGNGVNFGSGNFAGSTLGPVTFGVYTTGGANIANTISHNTGDGVRLLDPAATSGTPFVFNFTGNAVAQNTIENNGGNGINFQISQGQGLTLNMTGNTVGASAATGNGGLGLRAIISGGSQINATIGSNTGVANSFSGNHGAGVGISLSGTTLPNTTGSISVQNSSFNNNVAGGPDASFATGIGMAVLMNGGGAAGTDPTLTKLDIGDPTLANPQHLVQFNSNAGGGFLLDMHDATKVIPTMNLINVQANSNGGNSNPQNGATIQLAGTSSIGDNMVNGTMDLNVLGTIAGAGMNSNFGNGLRISRGDNSGLAEVHISGSPTGGASSQTFSSNHLAGISLFNTNGILANTEPTVYVIDHNTIGGSAATGNLTDGVSLTEQGSARVIAGINQNTISGNHNDGIDIVLNQSTALGDVAGTVTLAGAVYTANNMAGNHYSLIDGNTFSTNGVATGGANASAIAITVNPSDATFNDAYVNLNITGTLQRQTFNGDQNGINIFNNSRYFNLVPPANVVADNTFTIQSQDMSNIVNTGVTMTNTGFSFGTYNVGGAPGTGLDVNVTGYGSNGTGDGILYSGSLGIVTIQDAHISHAVGSTGGADGMHFDLTSGNTINISDSTILRSGTASNNGDGINIQDTGNSSNVTILRTQSDQNQGRGLNIFVNTTSTATNSVYNIGDAADDGSAPNLARNDFSSNGEQGIAYVQRENQAAVTNTFQSPGFFGGNPALGTQDVQNIWTAASPGTLRDGTQNIEVRVNVVNNDINSNGNRNISDNTDGSIFGVGSDTHLVMDYSGNGRSTPGVLGNLGDDFRIFTFLSAQKAQTSVDNGPNNNPPLAADGQDFLVADPTARIDLLFGGNPAANNFTPIPVAGSPYNYGEQIHINISDTGANVIAGVTNVTNLNAETFLGGARGFATTGNVWKTTNTDGPFFNLNDNIYVQVGVPQDIPTTFTGAGFTQQNGNFP